jgi:hypothetical protein
MPYELTQYVNPELLILIPVLYIIGKFIKGSKIADWKIPFILGVLGIILAALWVFSTATISGLQDVLTALFSVITQGVLTAAAAVYANEILKQYREGAKGQNGPEKN